MNLFYETSIHDLKDEKKNPRIILMTRHAYLLRVNYLLQSFEFHTTSIRHVHEFDHQMDNDIDSYRDGS